MAVSATKQIPPGHDAHFVAGNPFTLSVVASAGTFTSPVLTMKTTSNATVYTTSPGKPTPTIVGQTLAIPFSAADSAALFTGTRQATVYDYSFRATVDGEGPFEVLAGKVFVHPVGTTLAVQDADPTTLELDLGATTIELSVTVGTNARALVFDPRDYGAAGDGLTDDTVAIQACVDAMEVGTGIGGGVLDLRNGEWLISDTILFNRWSGEVIGSGWTNAATYVTSGGDPEPSYGTTVRWAVGAGAAPMFQVRDSQGIAFRNIKFQGASASANPSDRPTAAINFHYQTGDNKGSNAKMFVDECLIGRFAWTDDNPDDHEVEVGVLIDGVNGNNDEWVISRCSINYCTVAGIQALNSQSTWNHIYDTTIDHCAIGIYTGTDMKVDGVYMNRNTLDWKLTTDLTLWANHYNTENATKIAELGSGSSFIMNGGDLGPFSGSTLADPMIEVADCRLNRIVLRDVDFDGVTTEKIAMKSNVATTNRTGTLVIDNCRGLDVTAQLDVNPAGTGHTRYVTIRDPASDTVLNTKLTTALGNSLVFGTGWSPAAAAAVTEYHIRKTADETLNAVAVVQADDHLKFAVGASETWVFEVTMFVAAGALGATADFLTGLSVPSGTTVLAANVIGPATNATASGTASSGNRSIAASTNTVGLLDNATVVVMIKAAVTSSSTAGDVGVTWAQSSSQVTDVTVKAGSFLHAYKVT